MESTHWMNCRPSGPCPVRAGRRRPRGEAGCQEFPGFLETLAGRGRSAVLITSRASEDWPGGIGRIAVGGLALREATGDAGELLAPCPAAALRPGRARRVRRRAVLDVTCPHVGGHLGHLPGGPAHAASRTRRTGPW
jgi:hypothetical protein